MDYQPLDKTKNEIRVLRFLNVSTLVPDGDAIKCSIENVPLEDVPPIRLHRVNGTNKDFPKVADVFAEDVDCRDLKLQGKEVHRAKCSGHDGIGDSRYSWGDFEALSYAWGNENNKKRIYLNNIAIDIPKNLEEALKALRRLPETALGMCYWVDYLCINQGNEKEKNEQVKRMKGIYGQARAVVVWLGQEEDMDKSAVEVMRYLGQPHKSRRTRKLPPRFNGDQWPAMFAFFQKPYWTRSWIMQELAVNHNSTLILCGRFKLTRDMIRFGADYCKKLLESSEDQSHQLSNDLDMSAWPIISRVYRIVKLGSSPKKPEDINSLLNLVRSGNATIQKDKIYSILGLLDPKISARIVPDYSCSLSVLEAYTNFTRCIIEETQRLEQIVFGNIPTEEGPRSWAVNWGLPFQRNHLRYLRYHCASRGLPTKIKFEERGKDGLVLICTGFLVDTVDGVAAGCFPSYHSTQPHHNSTRYPGKIAGALDRTLSMAHPKATEGVLLDIPWTSTYYVGARHTNSDSNQGWHELSQSSYYPSFDAFRKHNKRFRIGGQSLRDYFPQSTNESVDIKATLTSLRYALLSMKHRALITTDTGYLGLAPVAVRSGDVMAILSGCDFPIVLRPQHKNLYQVVGECYVHGLMDGEIVSKAEEENITRQEFVLC